MDLKDSKTIHLGAVSSLQVFLLPLFLLTFFSMHRLNKVLSASGAQIEDAIPMLTTIAVLVVGVIVVLGFALQRRFRIAKVLAAPANIDRVERSGKKIAISLKNGEVVTMQVKPLLSSVKADDVYSALKRIAPHAN